MNSCILLLVLFVSAIAANNCPSTLIINTFSASQFTSGGAVIASVPEGYKLIGGGFQGKNLRESYPLNATSWSVRTSAITASAAGPTTVTAYAIGLYDPENFWDVEVVESPPLEEGQITGSGSAGCRIGTTLVGGGAITDRFLTENYPNTIFDDATTANTWTASFGSASGFVAPTSTGLVVYALCIRPTGSGYSLNNLISSSATTTQNSQPTTTTATTSFTLGGGGFRTVGNNALATASYESTSNKWTSVGTGSSVQSLALGLTLSQCTSESGSDSSSTIAPTTAPLPAASCYGEVKIVARAGSSWTSDSTDYTIFDVSVINHGTCAITSASFPYYFVQRGVITQSWNLNLQSAQGYGTVEVYNPIAPGATYTVAGFIIANFTSYSNHFSGSPVGCSSCSN